MADYKKTNDIEKIGGYIDNEVSDFEKMSVIRAIKKHEDLSDLEESLREQKKAIKLAFFRSLLND